MKSNLKRNKNMTYDQKGNFFGMPRGEITGIKQILKKRELIITYFICKGM